MNIIIMRHGEAVVGADHDAGRALTDVGLQQAASSSAQLKTIIDPKTTLCLASPYLRAQQTAAVVCEDHGLSVSTVEMLTPDTPASLVLSTLEALLVGCNYSSIILVAHMPLVARLTALLSGQSMFELPNFDTANTAVLQADVVAEQCAVLTKFVVPLREN